LHTLALTLDVGLNHLLDQSVKVNMSLPAELGFGFGAISPEQLDLGRTEVPTMCVGKTSQYPA
jgi:hypothetical protein